MMSVVVSQASDTMTSGTMSRAVNSIFMLYAMSDDPAVTGCAMWCQFFYGTFKRIKHMFLAVSESDSKSGVVLVTTYFTSLHDPPLDRLLIRYISTCHDLIT